MSMTWSDVVHEQRKTAAIAQARAEHRQKRRGYAVQVESNAKLPALIAVAGVLSGLAAWKREGRRLRAQDWRALPIVRQFLTLLETQPTPSGAARGKVKPRAVAAPSAARSGGSSSNVAASAAAAAGAAAMSRAAGGQQAPQQRLQQQQQPTQQVQQGGGSAQKKASKKKPKKKR